jgi:nicotinamide-nucleotide amidase
MKIGLLIIGNEILDGKITDANTRQLSVFLNSLNLELLTTLTVKDDPQFIHLGLQNLFSQCDVVVTSGGLGPTKDDLTKEAIASFLGRKVSFSKASCEIAEKNYQRFNRPFPGKDHGYCYLPEGFIALENTTGFAPGLYAENAGKFLICGPGVPKEFKSLLDDHFINHIKNKFPASSELIESITVRTKKVPEEKIFGEVDTKLWDTLAELGGVSSLPTTMGVDIGVKIKANSKNELDEKKKHILNIFANSPIAPHIWQIGILPLEEYIVKIANLKNKTYGFAESCTGGLCSHRMTNISGSSQTFYGSVVCYDESVKENILGVSKSTLKDFGAVSLKTAEEMSLGLSQALNVDIAIAITGLAGPGGGSEEKPVGTFCLGITSMGKTSSQILQMHGDREQLKLRFSQAALFLLLEELERYS